MVYCGRPSTGCGNCKSRRIKCDEDRPHCRNCVKTNRDCPGYRDEVDLIFRKEEPGRRKKAKKSPSHVPEASKSARKRSRDDSDETEWNVEIHDSKRPKRRRSGTDAGVEGYKSLQWIYINVRRANSVPDLAQQAESNNSVGKQPKSFIMDRFVPRQASRNGTTRCAPDLAEKRVDGSALSLAMDAVEVAVMARTPDYEHLNQHAACLYGQALAATQQAMQDPAHATSDETLLAILLFALYESIVSLDHSKAAWTKHIEGAIAIVRARDLEQFENPRSLQLFRSVRAQMLTDALQLQQSLQKLIDPKDWLRDLEPDTSTASNLVNTSVAMSHLLGKACSLLSQSESPDLRAQVEALLEDAIQAQDRFSNDYASKPWEPDFLKIEISATESNNTLFRHDLLLPQLDSQPSCWEKNQPIQFDDVKIDPALLLHDCMGGQNIATEGVELTQEEATLFSLHGEPVTVG